MAKKSNEKKSEKPMFKAEGMKVANVRRLSDTVVAFSLLGAGLGLYGLKVIDCSKGKFIATPSQMRKFIATPSQKGKDGKYYDVYAVYFDEKVAKAIIKKVESMVEDAEEEDEEDEEDDMPF